MNNNYLACIEACQKCLIDCQYCLSRMATKESHNECPYCCIQCVEACSISIRYMVADNKWAKKYCQLCAEICDWCAKQCESHDHDHCQRCATSCRHCAEECRKIAA